MRPLVPKEATTIDKVVSTNKGFRQGRGGVSVIMDYSSSSSPGGNKEGAGGQPPPLRPTATGVAAAYLQQQQQQQESRQQQQPQHRLAQPQLQSSWPPQPATAPPTQSQQQQQPFGGGAIASRYAEQQERMMAAAAPPVLQGANNPNDYRSSVAAQQQQQQQAAYITQQQAQAYGASSSNSGSSYPPSNNRQYQQQQQQQQQQMSYQQQMAMQQSMMAGGGGGGPPQQPLLLHPTIQPQAQHVHVHHGQHHTMPHHHPLLPPQQPYLQPKVGRLPADRPLVKLSVSLIDTYKQINTVYYEERDARRAARAKEKAQKGQGANNNGWDDENYDYLITSGELFYGKYIIKERIGKGSFGQVVRAEDIETQKDVAIKIIKSKKPFLMQAKTEIELLMHLNDQDPDDQNNIGTLCFALRSGELGGGLLWSLGRGSFLSDSGSTCLLVLFSLSHYHVFTHPSSCPTLFQCDS
jgi:hypothetical protein